MSWSQLKPLFDAMFFDLGPNEINRRTGLAMGTIYDLSNGVTEKPAKRTIRDLVAAIREWQGASVSETERKAV